MMDRIQMVFADHGEYLDLEGAWPSDFIGVDTLTIEQYRDIEVSRLNAGTSMALCYQPPEMVREAMDCLTSKERLVITAIADGATEGDLATRLKVTRCRVHQIKQTAKRKLKFRLGKLEMGVWKLKSE